MLVWIFQPMDSAGDVMKRPFMMFEFSTLSPLSNRQSSLSACYKNHERLKKSAYEQRAREVEYASFTPLVLSATCRLANEATHFYKRLASGLTNKWDQPYSSTISWLRCRFLFFSPSFRHSKYHRC